MTSGQTSSITNIDTDTNIACTVTVSHITFFISVSANSNWDLWLLRFPAVPLRLLMIRKF